MLYLINDVWVVIYVEGVESVVIVGYDWGGIIVWFFVVCFLEMMERLVIVNFFYFNGLVCELVFNEM